MGQKVGTDASVARENARLRQLARQLSRRALADPRLRALRDVTCRGWSERLAAAAEGRDIAAARKALLLGAVETLRANARISPPARAPFVGDSDGAVLYTVPSAEAYGEDSWKWDLAFGAMIASRCASLTEEPALARALDALAEGSLFAVFEHQTEDGVNRGMTPHMNIRSRAAAQLFGRAHASTITQPCVAAMAVRTLRDGAGRRRFLPALAAELDWWHRERLTEDGLPFVIHPWETGEDASADQDDTLSPYIERGGETSLATAHGGNKDPVTARARFALARDLADLGPDIPSGAAAELYQHVSPAMAAHVVRALEDTRALASEAGDGVLAALCAERGERLAQRARDRLWDPAQGLLVSRNRRGPIRAAIGSTFVALGTGIPTLQQAGRMLEALRDERRFWTALPVPTLAADDPRYRSDRYWRGSTWIHINHLTCDGLVRSARLARAQGDAAAARRFADTAIELGWRTVAATALGLDEYYDSASTSRRAAGAPTRFTWSGLALLTLDLVETLG